MFKKFGLFLFIFSLFFVAIMLHSEHEKTIDTLQNEVYNRDVEIQELNENLEIERERIAELKEKLEAHREQEVSRGHTRKFTCEATYYTHTGYVCSNGNYPVAGRTVACNFLPLGTKVRINGHIYIVEDTGGMGNNVIDIFVDTHEEAIQNGRHSIEVEVI